MKEYKKDFIEFCLENKVLLFGDFTLKSGRKSPYFFNAGLFRSGKSLQKLGNFYAKAIMDHFKSNDKFPFDVMFGPAYKGIPLVAATAIALYNEYQLDVPFAYNRKEVKDHGEGGQLVGSPLKGDIILVDDVITAGTAIRESIKLIPQNEAVLKCVCAALDRQEKMAGSYLTAIEQIEREFKVKVVSIIKLVDILEFLEEKTMFKELEEIKAHWEMVK